VDAQQTTVRRVINLLPLSIGQGRKRARAVHHSIRRLIIARDANASHLKLSVGCNETLDVQARCFDEERLEEEDTPQRRCT
jgi:hypothetical protein